MITVQKQNVVLDIEDDNLDKYLENGFCVIDEKGNIIKACKPTTIEQYASLVDSLNKELEDAKKKIVELQAEVESLKTKPKTTTNTTTTRKTKRTTVNKEVE